LQLKNLFHAADSSAWFGRPKLVPEADGLEDDTHCLVVRGAAGSRNDSTVNKQAEEIE
jgi:hypothetical protein